jgi:recombinational DNA repair ATPase RecF
MDLRIKSVRIQNFRSIADATLELSSGINVLAGPNGSGKSNILKAISRFSERNTFSQNDQSRFSRESFRIDAGTIYGHSLRIEGQNIIYNNNKISGFRSNIF